MNSFDVFDTLIARRTLTTHYVWEQLEKEFNILGFAKQRPVPDDGSKSFLEIYQALVNNGFIPSDLMKPIMDREVELEIEHSYPIQENMDRVADGDLLISDMYLPGSIILQMVRAAGLNRQVTIYQSNADKGKGIVWKKLLPNPPNLHLGDNEHTDLNQPRTYGISAELCNQHIPSQVEKFLLNNDLRNLGFLVREVRLRNSIDSYKEYFNLSCQVNLPLIFIMLEQLHRKHKDRPIVFLGRDCQLMWRIYNSYYGTAYYLPFSRKVAYNQPELAAKYLKLHVPTNGVLVDISSTGETWTFMSNYGDFDIQAVIYSDDVSRPYLPNTFSYLTKNSECGQTNLVLEIMNCGDHGHLDSLTDLGENLIKTNFANTELPFEIIQAVHTPMYDAAELSQYYKVAIREELNRKSDEALKTMFATFSSTICAQQNLLTTLKEFHKSETIYHEEILTIRKNLRTINQ
jgi:hypothetical protein